MTSSMTSPTPAHHSSPLSARFLVLSMIALPLILQHHAAWAAMPDALYLANLKAANAQVVKRHARTSALRARILTPLMQRLVGRNYRIGDSWNVVLFPLVKSVMTKTSEPENQLERAGTRVALHYQVTSVSGEQTQIRITQAGTSGAIELTLDENLRTEALSFPKVQSPARTHVLELLPLAPPDLLLADEQFQAGPAEPELSRNLFPDAIMNFVKDLHLDLKLAHPINYEAEDPFGRGITLSWDQGKLWPAKIRTQNGVAFLIPEAP